MSNRDWKAINNRLVQQGTLLIDFGFLRNRKKELAGMNTSKEGAPFEYPDSVINYAGNIHCLLHFGFRQTDGFLEGVSKKVPALATPHYSTINRRFNKLPAKIKPKPKKKNEPFFLAIDASGMCVTNRSEWMRLIHKKGKIQECKGFLKIHVGVDVITGALVSIKTTTDETGDNTMFDAVLFDAIENTGRAVDKVFADGAYDTYENFEKLEDMGIDPIIPVDKNSITAPPPDTFIQRRRGEPVRRKHARKQLADQAEWKKQNHYGRRWMVETFFSTFKRRYGDSVQATKTENMHHELLFKAQLCNQLP